MADRARGGEAYLGVVRVRRPVVILCMAAIAIGGQRREVVIDVAHCAGNRGMGAGQWELGLAVVKHRARPRTGRVAYLACSRETSFGVIWISRFVVVRLMASVAIQRQCREVAVDVAL